MEKLKIACNEFMYWHFNRPGHRMLVAFVWRLPKPVVYWCVVRAATKAEPNLSPEKVTAIQMLEAMK
jgi:hypothetical protein